MPYRLDPSARPKVWTRLEPCNVCYTAVPSKIESVGSMPCITTSPAATFCGGHGAMFVPTGGAPGVDGVTIDAVERSGVPAFLDDLAEALRAGMYRPAPLRRV